MTSRSLPKVLHPKKANSLEAERENFEKIQNISINKAINQQEVPVKEKHVRSAIIGTFSDKGAAIFWSVVTKLPLQGNPIICWKFLHVVHKLLREGHPNVIKDSLRYQKTLTDLGKLWGHLKEGYGKLIFHYCKLLLVKLDFHKKNPRFPGNLHVSDEELENIGEHDVNNFFQMAVEMFDYMDEILQLQATVFGSLDMSRSNSMTSSGQCRLAPLIPCIQDSSHLYDFCVKLLFKMHSSLPPDLLFGHRDRFTKQFKSLQQFYISSSNLQYFKYLIQIPLLPEDPPNFFIASNLNSHVSPVVILPPQAQTPDRDEDSVDMNLVDTSSVISTSPTRFDDVFGSARDFGFDERNGTATPDERDKLIEELRKEIINLQIEIQRQAAQNLQTQSELTQEIENLKGELSQLRELYDEKCKDYDELQTKLQENSEDSNTVLLLAEVERKAKANEEKFSKMKDVYGKLREEHIALIRVKADLDKQLGSAQKKESEAIQSQQALEEQIHHLEHEQQMMSEKVQQSSDHSQQITQLANEKLELSKLQEESLAKLQTTQEKATMLEQQVALHESEKNDLEKKLAESEAGSQNALQRLRSDSMMKQLDILAGILDEASSVVKDALEDMENPLFATNTCTPELLAQSSNSVITCLQKISDGHTRFENNQDDIEGLTNSIGTFSHVVAQFMLQGKATSNTSPDIELGDELALLCKNLGNESLDLFSAIKNKDETDDVSKCIEIVRSRLDGIVSKTNMLVSKIAGNQTDKIGDMLTDEMSSMDRAIEAAARRIAEMLDKSRQADSGVKLEVNGKILDSCTGLMQAIKVLVTSSKHLQKEIVDQGRGSATATEFYKRNHRWSEGFLSAAKEVGMGAKFLVDAADKVVNGKSKFEELVVASQEIAAGTAQLVIASKVKADRDSVALAKLSTASKGVTEATGNVVATSKSCADLIEDSDTMDFSKMSLHQAKRYEMDSQVRVLELESALQKERVKLAGLRKQHYQLAGPSEGWEVTDVNQP